jgi:hypothetical protein
VPLLALLVLLWLFFVTMAFWTVETEPLAQLREAAVTLVLAGLTGVAAGLLAAWTLAGGRRVSLVVGAILGALPTVLAVSAYFTDAY